MQTVMNVSVKDKQTEEHTEKGSKQCTGWFRCNNSSRTMILAKAHTPYLAYDDDTGTVDCYTTLQ